MRDPLLHVVEGEGGRAGEVVALGGQQGDQLLHLLLLYGLRRVKVLRGVDLVLPEQLLATLLQRPPVLALPDLRPVIDGRVRPDLGPPRRDEVETRVRFLAAVLQAPLVDGVVVGVPVLLHRAVAGHAEPHLPQVDAPAGTLHGRPAILAKGDALDHVELDVLG